MRVVPHHQKGRTWPQPHQIPSLIMKPASRTRVLGYMLSMMLTVWSATSHCTGQSDVQTPKRTCNVCLQMHTLDDLNNTIYPFIHPVCC
jgi:hypothetical protein